MILATIPTYNEYTNKQEGVTIGLIPIDLISIKTIVEEEETGFATIHYKGGSPLETHTPFIEMLDIFNRQGIIEFKALPRCLKVSKPLQQYINELKK